MNSVNKVDARDLVAELDDTPFEFVGLDGKTYTLPNVQTLPSNLGKRFAAGDETVLEELAPKAYKAIMEMPNGVAGKLLLLWVEAGGVAGKED